LSTLKLGQNDRLAALVKRLKELLASPTDKSLAESIGISMHVVHRMHRSRVSFLSEENTKQLCSFLGIEKSEFEQYLQGNTALGTITRNVEQIAILDAEESARALETLKKEILPKLAFPDCLEAMREIQLKFWSTADDYIFVKRGLYGEQTATLLANALTIAELLQGQNLDAIAQQVNLDRGRLGAIARGEEPRCEELTLLSASLGIPIKDLEVLRKRQFDKNHHEQSIGERANG